MYRAVLLDESDKGLHRFVWRRINTEPLFDYRMTRVTFGVSASSYAANMAVSTGQTGQISIANQNQEMFGNLVV